MEQTLYAYLDSGVSTKYTTRLAQVPDGRRVGEYRLVREGICTHAAEIKTEDGTGVYKAKGKPKYPDEDGEEV